MLMKRRNKEKDQREAVRIPLMYMMRWWKCQSLSFDRGGSFNTEHYLRICDAKMKLK